MLTGRDDHLGHQIPSTFDHVYTSDPMWTERLWFTIEDIRTGTTLFDCGLGQYPNKNVQDAFAGVTFAGKQYNVRMSRALRPESDKAKVGPLSFHLLEGMKRHRLLLEENPSGLSFDIEWEGKFNPHEEEHHYRRRAGKVVEDLCRYSQVGRARGRITLPGGKTLILTPDYWFAQRDHSWGIRTELRTEADDPQKTYLPPYLYNWIAAQFPSCGLHVFFNERAPRSYMFLSGEILKPLGEKPDRGLRLVGVDHELVWEKETINQTLLQGELILTFENGTVKTFRFRTLPGRYYLRSGLYGAWKGWYHGDYKGPYYFEHDVWDLSDHTFMKRIGTFSDHVIVCEMDGEVGYGVIEYGVTKGYPRYQEVQHLPPF
ncbi:MAG: hypothetical protein NZ578_14525 [Candidatus Binatia bacterium]|nr:hypothetical protein [Candidatus Binatia bacterium]